MAFKKVILVSIFYIAFAQALLGQKQLFITPSLGLSFPFSTALQAPVGDTGFRPTTFHFGPSFDLSLQYDIEKKWVLFAGWRASDDTGYNIRYGEPKKDRVRGRLSMFDYTSRFPIGIQRNLTTCKWVKIKRRVKILGYLEPDKINEDILYLVLFRLRGVAGFSFNHKVPSTYEDSTRSFSNGTDFYTVENRNTTSVFIGLNLQFFNYQKDRIQLSFLYSRGLQHVLEADIHYKLLSGDYYAKLGSRGSYFSIQMGYPIRLVKFK